MATKAHTVSSFYLGGFVSPQSEGNRKITPFVWMGDINTGEIKRRAPRKISIVRGFYDGPSTFKDSTASLEVDFANKIESAASRAIRKFAATPLTSGALVSQDILIFLS
jgi:hypothetical protein